ncbi:MAG: protein kinase [Myxococcota bacterium]
MSDAKKLEAMGRLEDALRAFVSQRDWDGAARVAVALNRPLDAGRFHLEAQRPWDAAVCFQRGGAMQDCLNALVKVPAHSPRYRSACVQAVRVAPMLGAHLDSFATFFMPFIAQAPAAPVEAEAMKSIADAFVEKGKARLAVSIYRTVVSSFPGDADARERLEVVEREAAAPPSPPPTAPPAPTTSPSGVLRMRQRLSELLISKGLVSKAQLDRMLRDQPELGASDAVLGEAVVAAGFLKDVDLLRALSELSGIAWLSDDDAVANVRPEAAKVLSLEQAEQWRIAPLKVVDRQLHVAMLDPRDVAQVDRVRFAVGMKVVPYFATAAGIRRATGMLYRGEDPGATEVSSWHGQLYSADSEMLLEPFSDRHTGTREHRFDTNEFNLIERNMQAELERPPQPASTASPPPGTATAPGVGSRVANRYQLEALLGEGGSASVYRALDLELNEPVALKVFRPMTEREAETLVARFKLELSLSRLLAHPNIIRLFDLGLDNGWRYLTMELLEGEDLSSLMRKRGGPLPLGEALPILEQVCAALQAAHERGVVHRDVKPHNVFVTTSGVVKLMDFGIARRLNTPGVTMMGTIAGTPEYMSPEQINGFSEVTAPADLYALGATAYEVLTGGVPFSYSELTRLLIAQATEAPKSPRAKNPAIPVELDELLLRLLEKDSARRPASAAEVGAAFRSIREALARLSVG